MTTFAFKVLRAQWRYKLVTKYGIQTKIVTGKVCKNKYVSLDEKGFLHIASGYSWDGPSGPTIDTPDFMRGSLVHDALYQLITKCDLSSKHRKAADQIFRDILLEDKMWKFRAYYSYWAVRIFGGFAV